MSGDEPEHATGGDPAPLRDPVLVAAFEGWNDAANAASDALRFLLRLFDANEVHDLDAESYFDFQAARPHVEIVNGVARSLRWPSTKVYTARVPDGARDLVLALGIEPNLHWPAYCREILGVARAHGCSMAVTLGALLGDTPHTRPIGVTGTASDPRTAARLGLVRSRYEGPTGIVGVLADLARRADFAAVSLWAPLPHYVASPPNPKATLALLERFADLVGIPIDLRNLGVAARGWEEQVNAVTESDNDLRDYVQGLEARYDGRDDSTELELVDDDEADDEVTFDDDLEEWTDADWDDDDEEEEDDDEFDEDDLPSGDSLAADFERYLREQRGDDTP